MSPTKLRGHQALSWKHGACLVDSFFNFYFFNFFYSYLRTFFHRCLEGKERKEGERATSTQERNMHWLPPAHAPNGNGTCTLGMCPDQNPTSTFQLWEDAPNNRDTGPGLDLLFEETS